MKINNLPFSQQRHSSTSKVSTSSLFKDIKNLFDETIKNPQPTSLENKYSSADVSCRNLRNFLNDYIPH